MIGGFELVTRRFEFVTHGFELITRGFELVNRGFEKSSLGLRKIFGLTLLKVDEKKQLQPSEADAEMCSLRSAIP